MKIADIIKGLLVTNKAGDFWGEVIDLDTHGTILVLAYSDNHRHFVKASKLQRLEVIIEPDSGMFHSYVPSLKAVHSCGVTREEAYSNIRDATRLYLKSMVKHGEIPKRPSVLGRRDKHKLAKEATNE